MDLLTILQTLYSGIILATLGILKVLLLILKILASPLLWLGSASSSVILRLLDLWLRYEVCPTKVFLFFLYAKSAKDVLQFYGIAIIAGVVAGLGLHFTKTLIQEIVGLDSTHARDTPMEHTAHVVGDSKPGLRPKVHDLPLTEVDGSSSESMQKHTDSGHLSNDALQRLPKYNGLLKTTILEEDGSSDF